MLTDQWQVPSTAGRNWAEGGVRTYNAKDMHKLLKESHL